MPELDEAVAVGQMFASRARLAILAYLRDHGPSTMADLAAGLNSTRQTLQRPLSELREVGWITTSAEPPMFRPLVMNVDRAAIQAALDRLTSTFF